MKHNFYKIKQLNMLGFTTAILFVFVFKCFGQASEQENSLKIFQITLPMDYAECPTWDNRTGLLYYVDIHSGKIYSFDYKTKETNFVQLNGEVAPVIPTKKHPHRFIVGVNRSLVEIEWDGRKGGLKSEQLLTTLQKHEPFCRTNDGKADRNGRIWIGTMGFETKAGDLTHNNGALFRISKDNILNPDRIISPVNISNGLAWNKANNKFYYIDTPTQKIVQYDYNDNGHISNRKEIFNIAKQKLNEIDLPKHNYPDGMTIDKDDNLWIALYGGSSVIKVNPNTGKLLQTVPVPAAKAITSVAWGGPNLDVLFVTTSRYSLNDEERLKLPAAGSVFAVTGLGTKGLPENYADIS